MSVVMDLNKIIKTEPRDEEETEEILPDFPSSRNRDMVINIKQELLDESVEIVPEVTTTLVSNKIIKTEDEEEVEQNFDGLSKDLTNEFTPDHCCTEGKINVEDDASVKSVNNGYDGIGEDCNSKQPSDLLNPSEVIYLDIYVQRPTAWPKHDEISSVKTPKHCTFSEVEEKIFSCTVCVKTFRCKDELEEHRVIHRVKRHYSCSECSEVYGSSRDLMTHVLNHSAGKAFRCSKCMKGYSTSYSLKYHRCCEKKLYCSKCDQNYTSRSAWKAHRLTGTRKKLHTCTRCREKFESVCVLNKHMLSHAEERRYSCRLCDKPYRNKGSLQRHLVVVHGQQS
ncbi:zinc finger protein 8 isoform X2 [Anabrus simplex]|uniref:zinc finger protein 8 isoform X2 n=1 Tax=Anabrus simplex TaxID=316456 RepID=UPI0035A3B203